MLAVNSFALCQIVRVRVHHFRVLYRGSSGLAAVGQLVFHQVSEQRLCLAAAGVVRCYSRLIMASSSLSCVVNHGRLV